MLFFPLQRHINSLPPVNPPEHIFCYFYHFKIVCITSNTSQMFVWRYLAVRLSEERIIDIFLFYPVMKESFRHLGIYQAITTRRLPQVQLYLLILYISSRYHLSFLLYYQPPATWDKITALRWEDNCMRLPQAQNVPFEFEFSSFPDDRIGTRIAKFRFGFP